MHSKFGPSINMTDATPSILTVRVAKKTGEAMDICGLELVDVDGRDLPAFSAGSHIDVHLPNGLTRQYSLCNSPNERHRYVIGVLKDGASRGGSRSVHDDVLEGESLRISAPRNHFHLAEEADSHLLLAGGIGVTPILSMAEQLLADGKNFEMHYCARSVNRMAYFDRIVQSDFSQQVQFHFDDENEAQRLNLDALLDEPRVGVHLYVCGPKGFMDAVLSMARAKQWPEAQLHYEFFAADPISTEGDQSFLVKLAKSGRVVTIPKDVTVAQALAAAGVEVPTSCEQGLCGSCLTRVVTGKPDHKDMYLTEEERARNDQFLPCCSRSKSPILVLDL
jgi:vanillate O-demethylase ferredoxin subunit